MAFIMFASNLVDEAGHRETILGDRHLESKSAKRDGEVPRASLRVGEARLLGSAKEHPKQTDPKQTMQPGAVR